MQASPPVRAQPFWLAWANRPDRAIVTAFVVSLVVVAGTLALHGTGVLGWRLVTRRTAQIAFPLFLIAFTASSFAKLRPGPIPRALLARRRAIGLAFATAQLIHGAAIVVFLRIEGRRFEPDGAFFGGLLGFVFVVAMAATSNEAAVRRLGRRGWRALHRAGMVWLFVIYAATYAGRVARDPGWWPGLALLVAALAVRLAGALQSRSLRSSTLPIE
jgi:sulfoxide reductase heme-binding subunit YedZ